MEKAIRRDAHKTKTFVRFRLVQEEQGIITSPGIGLITVFCRLFPVFSPDALPQ